MNARQTLREMDEIGRISFPDFRARFANAEMVVIVTGSGEREASPNDVRVGDIIEVPDETGQYVRLRVTSPSMRLGDSNGDGELAKKKAWMNEIVELRSRLWRPDKNGYQTLSDEQLNDAEVLRAAIASLENEP